VRVAATAGTVGAQGRGAVAGPGPAQLVEHRQVRLDVIGDAVDHLVLVQRPIRAALTAGPVVRPNVAGACSSSTSRVFAGSYCDARGADADPNWMTCSHQWRGTRDPSRRKYMAGLCASADSTCRAGSSRYVSALPGPSAVRQVGAKRACAVLPRGPQKPHKSAAGRRPHRKPTDETELCGTRRHGRYDGYKTGWPARMRVSWAFECSSNYGFKGDRTPEKRKVGGSTPPLTTRFVIPGQRSLVGLCGDLVLRAPSASAWDPCLLDVLAGERAIFPYTTRGGRCMPEA